jgi:YD repeat-containing protein
LFLFPVARHASGSSSTADIRTWTYDQDGNVRTAANSAGGYIYTYDDASRLQTQTDMFGIVLAYGYDNADRVTSVSDSRGGVIGSVYDPAGRLSSRQLNTGGQTQALVSYTYTPRGQLATALVFLVENGPTSSSKTGPPGLGGNPPAPLLVLRARALAISGRYVRNHEGSHRPGSGVGQRRVALFMQKAQLPDGAALPPARRQRPSSCPKVCHKLLERRKSLQDL